MVLSTVTGLFPPIFPRYVFSPVGLFTAGLFPLGLFPTGISAAIFKQGYKLMTISRNLELVWFGLFWFGWFWLELVRIGLVSLG